MSLVLQSSGGGSITLEEAVTASNLTITVPATTATMAIDGPAFSAYNSGYQTVSNATWTKMNCDTENFDTNNNFASSRFTPTVAGYYQFNASTLSSSSATGVALCGIYKNGVKIWTGAQVPNSNTGPVVTLSSLLYANGSTDYFELYFYQNSGGNMTAGLGDSSFGFSGFLARAA